MKSFILALCSTLIFTACEKAKAPSDILKIGLSADYKPFEYFEDGKIVGFEVDLMDEIAKRLGKKPIYEDMAFDAILGSLKAGRIDLSISNFTVTKERQKNYDFSLPYLTGVFALLVKEDSKIQEIKEIKNLGFQAGSIYENRYNGFLKSEYPNLKPLSMTKLPDLIQSLRNGRIEGILLSKTEAYSIQKTSPDLRIIQISFESSNEDDYGIVFQKGCHLVKDVNRVLEEIIKDGTHDTLKKKWDIK